MKKKESANPVPASNELMEYLIDAAQRSVLYWDVMRQRGNQYLQQMAKTVPNVLQFDAELILDGRKLPQSVNYGIVRIRPPKGTTVHERRRPFVVFDPRAGHGPGIGGFKADSEIGEAMRAGHPCYFVGFTPEPMPGQTIEAVINAWAVFLEKVTHLHAGAEGKPVVIGNCQAGWALMMLASKYPGLMGPVIVAGSPLSYWGGVRGIYPMRYSGGMLGGTWLTTLMSDLGNGIFDGAYLVQNFENLNPANTLWTKQYNLYSNIDAEGKRYLDFERWWGGHVLLTGQEIQYIVDNLFVGNRLSTSEIVTSDGVRMDLRKITSPIVCLCSKGDNITPPQQALGWILDLYGNENDIMAHGQTIVYAVHENIGHLGIFVSSSVARKEHQEFASNIDLIDCLPPGLYEAVFREKRPDTPHLDLVNGDYISRFERRTLDDIRALGGNTAEDERCFAAVARLSEINRGLYRTLAQPLVKGMANEQGARLMRRMHPLRLSYEMLSDENPAMQVFEMAAQSVKDNRMEVSGDNLFLQWEKGISDWITFGMKSFGEWRDMLIENMFFGIYSLPLVQALLGQSASDSPPRKRPGEDPDHIQFVARKIEKLLAGIDQGGPREAAIRSLIYICIPGNSVDERGLEMLRRIRSRHGEKMTIPEFKKLVRDQYLMLMLDERRAIDAIPKLIKGHDAQAMQLMGYIRDVVSVAGSLNREAQRRLAEVEQLFGASTLVEVKPPKDISKPLAQGVEFEVPKQKSKPKTSSN